MSGPSAFRQQIESRPTTRDGRVTNQPSAIAFIVFSSILLMHELMHEVAADEDELPGIGVECQAIERLDRQAGGARNHEERAIQD